MPITNDEIQIWTANLAISDAEETASRQLLSPDEQERAQRLQFRAHQKYFIAARSMLRILLGYYLSVPPQTVQFSYSENKKPGLASANPENLQFNISHSHEFAVFAFTRGAAIGADIEKIKTDYHPGVVQRFFSEQEKQALSRLTQEERARAFYKIWAYKEAIIKAAGKTIDSIFSSFTLDLIKKYQTVTVDELTWQVWSLPVHPDFQTAIACNQNVKTISGWKYFDQQPILDKVYEF